MAAHCELAIEVLVLVLVISVLRIATTSESVGHARLRREPIIPGNTLIIPAL